ncbi:hypothetical protein StrepF001_07815 [Streptomyces sp. F001]|uniref:hypothetical protein n=1 Tax=Streptomyces sp. F001 TaxID=1510026 RepID=UPI00101E626A|nr:hypothetical protein [Streptomyces sp. F001]RZB18851.1 hypothetical protein StrepF001_07815 [Streptomyces sp. F001]
MGPTWTPGFNPVNYRDDPGLPSTVLRLLKRYEKALAFHFRWGTESRARIDRLAARLRAVWPDDELDPRYLASILAVLDVRAQALYSKRGMDEAEESLAGFWAANGLEQAAFDEVIRQIHIDLITLVDT